MVSDEKPPIPELVSFAVCDDIRAERDNKLTLVGYYGRSLNVGSIPGTLPKLCFLGQFPISLDAGSVVFRVMSPSRVLIMETPPVKLERPNAPTDVPQEYRYSQLVFQIAPMPVSETGDYLVEFAFSNSQVVRAKFYVSCLNTAAS